MGPGAATSRRGLMRGLAGGLGAGAVGTAAVGIGRAPASRTTDMTDALVSTLGLADFLMRYGGDYEGSNRE